MITIRVKKGLNLNITGQPNRQVTRLPGMDRVAVTPAAIPHIKPKLRVKEGDRVKQGGLLYTDKRNPDMAFVSPGGGTVETIDYGRRRVIRAVVIKLDKEETKEDFGTKDRKQLADMARDDLVRHLMAGGLWPFIRCLPFRDIADPAATPPAVIVNLDSLDPFHPEPSLYLDGSTDDFLFGLDALKRLAPEIYLVTNQDTHGLDSEIDKQVTHRVNGPYPADDPGVFLYHSKKSANFNRCWYIHGREVLLLGRFLSTGFYPVERLVTLSGPDQAGHVFTRAGAPVSLLAPSITKNENHRALVGGIWRGTAVEPEGYLGLYDTAVSVLPAGSRPEFFGFMRPGWRKFSYSRTFLSVFNRGPFTLDTGQHGEERACVNCGTCVTVCPVDILPQFTIKCVLAGEVEEALAHGLLDCVECGLCAYVCPSKVELLDILRQARKAYYKELLTAKDTP